MYADEDVRLTRGKKGQKNGCETQLQDLIGKISGEHHEGLRKPASPTMTAEEQENEDTQILYPLYKKL